MLYSQHNIIIVIKNHFETNHGVVFTLCSFAFTIAETIQTEVLIHIIWIDSYFQQINI